MEEQSIWRKKVKKIVLIWKKKKAGSPVKHKRKNASTWNISLDLKILILKLYFNIFFVKWYWENLKRQSSWPLWEMKRKLKNIYLNNGHGKLAILKGNFKFPRKKKVRWLVKERAAFDESFHKNDTNAQHFFIVLYLIHLSRSFRSQKIMPCFIEWKTKTFQSVNSVFINLILTTS